VAESRFAEFYGGQNSVARKKKLIFWMGPRMKSLGIPWCFVTSEFLKLSHQDKTKPPLLKNFPTIKKIGTHVKNSGKKNYAPLQLL
jgi:hypothetical protein